MWCAVDGWQWDEFHALHGANDFGRTVNIDPHVMCTPALGDLDSDGSMVRSASRAFQNLPEPVEPRRLAGALGPPLTVASTRNLPEPAVAASQECRPE